MKQKAPLKKKAPSKQRTTTRKPTPAPFTGKTLNLTNDVTFKVWAVDKRNRDSLIALLTAVIRPKAPIVSVEILNPELPRKTTVDKGPILDLRVRLNTGTHVHVEMQLQPHHGFRQRELYYLASACISQLDRGQDYETLHPTVGIFFLNFNDLNEERFHSTFRLLEIHSHRSLSDAIELHVLELKKLPKGTPAADADPVLRWCKFLAAKSDAEREQIAMIDPEIRKAKTALERLSKKRLVQQLAFDRQLEINTYRNNIQVEREKARAEGEAKGRAEGEAKGRAEALVQIIERLCQSCGVQLTQRRRATLATASIDELQRIVDSIAVDRVWPK